MRNMEQVVVVTGASSGVGRATAVAFARRHCIVVLAARRGDALEQTAMLCREAGGVALPVITDVTLEGDVQRLAHRALAEYGRIDIWINNAGITLFAPLAGPNLDDHRRVIETNLFGAMHCARAVVPIFRRQSRGTLINVGSILSKVGQPFVPSYTISKFALRGLSECLRVELADEPNIHVCTVFPYTIDTQHFESGGNHMGRQAYAMPPIQEPEVVARAIVRVAEHPTRERHVPRIAQLGIAVHALLPETSERLLLHALRRFHFARGAQHTLGSLYEPNKESARVHGHRRPRIGTARLLAWCAIELVRMQVQMLARRWNELRLMPRKQQHRRPA